MKQINNIEHVLDERVTGHILKRLLALAEQDRVVNVPGWKEIDLYEYIKGVYTGNVFSEIIGKNIIYVSQKDEHTSDRLSRPNRWNPFRRYEINPVIDAICEFYKDPSHEGAAYNDLFFDVAKDRVYGFVLLNMHTADIDIGLPGSGKPAHFMIRYNENTENTKQGWKIRCEYISRIFSGMGFDAKTKGGYVHMAYQNKGAVKEMQDIVAEAMRGLVSTTHLNIAFEQRPGKLEEAVEVFCSGTTNVFDYLLVKASRDEGTEGLGNPDFLL